MKGCAVASVTVGREEEHGGGWVFDVTVRRDDGAESLHAVSLSWVDYEHWSHGQLAPERVVRAVVENLVNRGQPERLPARFDAATARRWVKGFDQLMGREGESDGVTE